jgi:hypothetical protein
MAKLEPAKCSVSGCARKAMWLFREIREQTFLSVGHVTQIVQSRLCCDEHRSSMRQQDGDTKVKWVDASRI